MIRSLGTRVALLISGVLLGLMLLASAWIDKELMQGIQQEEIVHAEDQARALLTSFRTLMLNGNGNLARQWLDNLRGSNGIAEVEMLRRDGVRAFYDINTLNQVNHYLEKERFRRRATAQPKSELVGISQEVIEAALREKKIKFDVRGLKSVAVVLPIPFDEDCGLCHGYEESSIRGVFAITIARGTAESRVESMHQQLWLITSLLIVVLGLSLWMVLRRHVIFPVRVLHQAIHRAAEGDRAAMLSVMRDDELGELAKAFNRMQNLLLASEARIRAVMDNVVDGIVITNKQQIIETLNPSVSRIFGYSPDELLGQSIYLLLSDEKRLGSVELTLQELFSGSEVSLHGISREEAGRRKNGAMFDVELTISEMSIGGNDYYIFNLRDITRRTEQTAALRHQAMHDALTGLPNRSLLYDRLEQAISSSQREKRPFALMLLDLDRFKPINDHYGHHVGDMVLQHVGVQIQAILRKTDTLARLGGDEFSVLLPGTGVEAACEMVEKVLQAVGTPLQLEANELNVGGSIGLAMYPEHALDVQALLRCADAAMYEAKRLGDGYRLYVPGLDLFGMDHGIMAESFGRALDSGSLEMIFQPQLDLKTNRARGFELIPRWQYAPDNHFLGEELLRFAAKHDMAMPLIRWCLDYIARVYQSATWQNTACKMAFNMSASVVRDPSFMSGMSMFLTRYPGIQEIFVLEISESSYMDDPFVLNECLLELKRLGLTLCLDHYGIGGSPLMNLLQMPISEIKIDESYVQSMVADGPSRMAVRAMIDLGHGLGLRVVAAGANTPELLDYLTAYGCDLVQGGAVSNGVGENAWETWCEMDRRGQV